MAQVIDQYAIRIGFQLNTAQLAQVQNLVNGFARGLSTRVAPAAAAVIQNTAEATRRAMVGLDANVARMSKLGADLSVRLSAPLAMLSGYGIKSAAEIEKMNMKLEVMVGNAQVAGELQKQIGEYAMTSAYNIKDVTYEATRLLAMGATTPEGLMETVQTIGALGMGDNDFFGRIAYAYGQIKSFGRLMGPEARQLAESLVNIFPAIEKIRGLEKGSLTTKNIADLNITSEEVWQAMKLTSTTGPYMKMMEKLKGSLSVTLSGLAERFFLFAGAVGQSIREAIKLDKILDWVADGLTKIEKRLERMSGGQKKLLVAVIGFLVAVGPLTYLMSVWMRMGAVLLRTFDGLWKIFMGLKAGGGIFKAIFGAGAGVGIKAFGIVAIIAAVVALLYLVVDDLLAWKAGGKSIFGYFFGKKEDWEWIKPILDSLKYILDLYLKVLAWEIKTAGGFLKRILPSEEDAAAAGGAFKWWGGKISDGLPFAPPTAEQIRAQRASQQAYTIKVPFVGITPQTRDSLARIGAVTAPQNNYVREFDLIHAGASAGVE